MTFEIFRRPTLRGKRWFWRLRAANGRVVASGQSVGFHNKRDVLAIIDTIVALDAARIEDDLR